MTEQAAELGQHSAGAGLPAGLDAEAGRRETAGRVSGARTAVVAESAVG